MKKLITISILFLCLTLLFADPVLIPADNPHFYYTGRIDFTEPVSPIFYWPGTSVETKFTGTSLQIKLDDEKGDNFYNVFIDGDFENPIIVDCQKGDQVYPVTKALKDTTHSLLIFRRTEGFSGLTKFKGILVDENSNLETPIKKSHKIEFFGDSITCGMGNEVADDAEDEDNSKRNNFLAYGAITARNLDAEYHCTAKSGIGIIISWFPMIMPEYYNRLNPADSTSNWNFEQWTPDVVVINLFQNDSWLMKRLDPIPTDEQRVKAYYDFVKTLRSHYPDAFIVCALGSMDATKEGSKWPGYIESAVKMLHTENDQNIDTCFFPFVEDFYKHPRVRHHKKNAEQLTAFIKEKMNW